MGDYKFSNFGWLINPILPESFFETYWEQSALLIQRNESEYWSHLLSLEIVDQVISTLNLDYPELSLTNANGEIPKDNYLISDNLVNLAKVYQYYNDGHTIILNSQNNRVPSLANLCRTLELEFGMPFQTNVYLTPADAQGFTSHYDDHCVFILQISGTKRWRIYQKIIEFPTKDFYRENRVDNPGFPEMEFDLNPGDILYIPRGIVHDAVTSSTLSLHITLGALARTWVDIFPDVIKTLLSDSDFRKSLPIGTICNSDNMEEMFQTYLKLINKFNSKQVFEKAYFQYADRFLESRKAILPGQLFQMKKIIDIDFGKAIIQRSNLLYRLVETSESIHIYCYGNQISFPSNLKALIQYILNTRRFFITNIPGNFEIELKKVIVQKLICNGLVMIED